ncbi:hypothetical protein LPJGGPFB_03156 [Ensifer adhaerens]|nr:hypothetical protein [Ensifer adhaerens]NRP19898.1 hypothetical protein [Ensifer adhaerens]
MTGTDHEHSETVTIAAQWLADQRDPPHPIVPELRSRFGLSALECCEAISRARQMTICRKAFG